MNNDKLTAFDNFIIGKNKYVPQVQNDEKVCDNAETTNFSASYAQYLKDQLRRTQPSEERVLTQEEFEVMDDEETRKNRMWKALGGKGRVRAESDGTAVKNVQFKKFGKILLCAYVIIMLCLALIVIVKTTVGDKIENADASVIPPKTASHIETMQEEEEEKEENWFDNLCDSLK